MRGFVMRRHPGAIIDTLERQIITLYEAVEQYDRKGMNRSPFGKACLKKGRKQ
jgi:hypothetical protein